MTHLERQLEKASAQRRSAMETQRAARLARPPEPSEPVKESRPAHVYNSATHAGDIFALIDDSAGPNACHPWTGDVTSTWPAANKEAYDAPRAFDCHGTHRIAQRIILAEFYNVGVLSDRAHVHQECGNRVCCNLSHQLIGPRNSGIKKAISPDEYFTKVKAGLINW